MIFSLQYLLYPLTIWQSSQLLVEALIAPFVALIVYLFVAKREKFSSWIAIALTSIFLAICKSSFIPLLFAVPLAYFIDNKKTLKLFVKATLLFIVSILLFSFVSPIFKDNASPKNPSIKDYLGIINIGVPEKSSNMDYYFNLNKDDFDYVELLENFKIKTVHGLKVQFIQEKMVDTLCFLPFNLMLLGLFYLLYVYSKEKKKKYLRLSLLGFSFFLLHLSTICLMQNQFRYMLMIFPAVYVPSVIAFYIWSKELKKKKSKYNKALTIVLFIFIILLVVVDGSIASVLRNFSIEERNNKEIFENNVVSMINVEESVLMQATTNYAMMAYALKPRKVLFVLETYTTEEYEKLTSSIDSKWLLCEDGVQMIGLLGIEGNERYRLHEPFTEFLLIKLELDVD
jgi:hypothetical protein